MQTVLEQIASLGHDTDAIWGDIQKLCLRTVAATAPHLWQTYHSTVLNEEGPSMAFQIIGIDVMLDHQLRPFLLETNNGPSFNMDADIDRDIKLQVGTSRGALACGVCLLHPRACDCVCVCAGHCVISSNMSGFYPLTPLRLSR